MSASNSLEQLTHFRCAVFPPTKTISGGSIPFRDGRIRKAARQEGHEERAPSIPRSVTESENSFRQSWQTILVLPTETRSVPVVARLYEGSSDVESRYVTLEPANRGT